MKVDVCIVTKNSIQARYIIQKLRNVNFINKIIIETSKPLGIARMRAIQKVETEWFLFIDDDIIIPEVEKWFKTLISYISPEVGAIQGIDIPKGLGDKMDNALKSHILSQIKIGEISRKKWSRGYTHNTLIRTKLVKDWKPSNEKLSALEDLELTIHIQSKGYKWIVAPVIVYHFKTWKGVIKNALWTGKSIKYCNIYSTNEKLLKIVKNIFWILRCLIDPSLNFCLRVRLYSLIQNLCIIFGFLFN